MLSMVIIMANCYLFIMSSLLLIQIYGQSLFKNKVDLAVSLINSDLVYKCISQDSLLESYEYGYKSLELDIPLLVEVIDMTLSNNYPDFKFENSYFFYDSYTWKNCLINTVPCNSFQVKFKVSYHSMNVIREKRYEFIEKKGG